MTELRAPDQLTDLPVACTLGPDDGPARMHRWERLHRSAGPVAVLRGRALVVTYQASPGVLTELTELAAAEQVCCSFVAWTVGAEDGLPVLRVTAPPGAPEAVQPIAGLFGVGQTAV